MIFSRIVTGATSPGLLLCLAIPAARAQEKAPPPVALSASFTGDVVMTGGAGGDGRVRYLDDIQVAADIDGARLIGWRGMTARVNLLGNMGAAPNDGGRTLQGIDNIEVAERRVRLYEAWVEQRIGRTGHSLRIGLYDINSDFYLTPAARMLVMPAFGIGSELAASGPNGPSTYPLTALGGRARVVLGGRGGYAMAAIVNAEVGLLNGWQRLRGGDTPSGLLLFEAGMENDKAKVAVGGWRYTRAQPVFLPPGVDPEGETAGADGAYVLAQYRVTGAVAADRPVMHVFTRIGRADGRTTPFGGGGQWGALIERPFAGRPESTLSLGVNTGWITDAYRRVPVGMRRPPRTETALELTYADRVLPFLTIQPDIQYVFHPARADARGPVIVALMRARVAWARPEARENDRP